MSMGSRLLMPLENSWVSLVATLTALVAVLFLRRRLAEPEEPARKIGFQPP